MSRHLPVIVPFKEGQQIGRAYNREMARLPDDGWAVLMDYDVMIMNPHWHEICCRAINRVGERAGLISCLTNRIGCKMQIAPGVDPENFDMKYHRDQGKRLWLTRKGTIRDHTETRGCRFSGFFMLTSKRVWSRVGGFKTDSFFHVDVDYYDKCKRNGFRVYLMEDLYCFHMYLREVLSPFFTEDPNATVKENSRTPKEARV